jgi:hypothetical protein
MESLIADFLSMFTNCERNASMSKNLQIHVGDSLEDIGARTIDAWYRMGWQDQQGRRAIRSSSSLTGQFVFSPAARRKAWPKCDAIMHGGWSMAIGRCILAELTSRLTSR